MSRRLDIGPDVAPVLRPEESARLHALRDNERLRCAICDQWIDPDSEVEVSVSVALEDRTAVAAFAHTGCAPSRADLVELVVAAEADPLGIAYAQATHPDAGAVLLWERKLDVRVRGPGDRDSRPYLDAQRHDGFHGALAREPVRELGGLTLEVDGPDLVLLRAEVPRERFHDAAQDAPPRWMERLAQSGYGLLIVGADLGLGRPGAGSIQRAIRDDRALMGLVEFRKPAQ
ncbi:MAG: hypothetical protein JWQ20_2398 [Conexibacter sp.]|nr:hypothetical protein [Conexibacter sp.]